MSKWDCVGGTDFNRTRIAIYKAGLRDLKPVAPSSTWRSRSPFVCGPFETRRSLEARLREIYPQGLGRRYRAYVCPTQSFFARFAPQAGFRIYAEDNRSRFLQPTILKSRLIADRGAKGVLLPLNFARHWAGVAELAAADRPFGEKDNRLVWRGAPTGPFVDRGDGQGYSARYHVARLGPLSAGIDIKYGPVYDKGFATDIPVSELRAHCGGHMTLSEQLSSKFLLSLEGNDVSSGLKWMMASNSTVVMPTPTTETWFCEGELQPWVHYVPVAGDLSNLNEVYEWCCDNISACEEIARNGTVFVRRFLDGRNELRLIQSIVEAYAAHTDYRLDFGGFERLAQGANRLKLSLLGHGHRRRVEQFASGLRAQQ